MGRLPTRVLLWVAFGGPGGRRRRASKDPFSCIRKPNPSWGLGLTDPAASNEAIIAAMILDPILVNRPIVATAKGAARPWRTTQEAFR